MHYFWISLSAAALTFVVTTLCLSVRTRRKISYMLDALEDNETNFRFREDVFWNRKLNMTLNRIKTLYSRERELLHEQERYYGTMLDIVSTGILVSETSGNTVTYTNSAALRLLGLSSLSSLRQLKNIDSGLYGAFVSASEGKEAEVTFINDMSSRTMYLKPAIAVIGGHEMTIISFNDISRSMNDMEAESWTKLVRVLTHEIMNTVTPIYALSDALVRYADKYGHSGKIAGAGIPDLKASLETISSSAKGLIRFADTYRSLMHIPEPSRQVVWLRDIVNRVMKLTEHQISEAGAECVYSERSDDIMLYADEGQISQIMVNLIRNALQAGASKIDISAVITADETVVVDVANDGEPVPEEKREEIFIPFYTTKSSGSGIGLSLSRQMMRKHNGTLLLLSGTGSRTVFRMIFR